MRTLNATPCPEYAPATNTVEEEGCCPSSGTPLSLKAIGPAHDAEKLTSRSLECSRRTRFRSASSAAPDSPVLTSIPSSSAGEPKTR
jgi:hypothetical protein